MDITVDQKVTDSSDYVTIKDLLLPVLRGYGDVKDTIAAMQSNGSIRYTIENLINNSQNGKVTPMDFEKFIAEWVGLPKEYTGSKEEKLWILEKINANYKFTEIIESKNFGSIHGEPYPGETGLIDMKNWSDGAFQEMIDSYRTIFEFQIAGFQGAYYDFKLDCIQINDINLFTKEMLTHLTNMNITLEDIPEVLNFMDNLGLSNSTFDLASLDNFKGCNYLAQFFVSVPLDYIKENLSDIKEILAKGLASDGNDSLNWQYTPLDLDMGDGNDYVNIGNFDNVITAGKGDDTIQCGTGNDTYIFNKGDGKDRIYDGGGDNDRIIFTDVNANEFGIYDGSYNMEISYGNGDKITLDKNTIEEFRFADGSYLTNEDINYIIQQMASFSADNSIYFGSAEELRMNSQFNQIVMNQLRRD